MQQFVVPQFIDVEAKIIGPVTVRQFLIIVAAGMTLVIAWKLVDIALFALFAFFIGGSALLVAFVPINGRPFHFFMLNIMENVRRPKFRVWGKKYTTKQLNYYRKMGTEVIEDDTPQWKKARPGAIRDLSLLVNTGGYYKPDLDDQYVEEETKKPNN